MKLRDLKGVITIKALLIPLPVNGMWFFGANLQQVKHGYEPSTSEYIKNHLKPGQVFIDIGANYGYYSVLAAKLGASVIAYEPDEISFRRLRRNVFINRIPERRIKLRKAAASDTDGEALFYSLYRGSGLNSLVQEVLDKGIPTKIRTEKCLDYYDLCKIDVEGAELKVLSGLKHRGTIICEFRPMGMDRMGTTPEAFLSTIRGMGWDVSDIEEGVLTDSALISKARERTNINILLTPSP